MSRIPGASPMTDDIEEIRRRGEDRDRSLEGDDARVVPEPGSGEEAEPSDPSPPRRPR